MKTPSHRYFPVSESQRAWGLYVTCAGRGLSRPGDEFPSRVHPDEYFFTWEKGRVLREWQIILLTGGRGSLEFKGRRQTVQEGALIVLPPGCWHRYRPNRRTGWSTLWVGFGGDVADRLAGGAGFNPEGEARGLASEHRFHRLFADVVADVLENGNSSAYSTAARIPALIASLMEDRSDGNVREAHADAVRRAQAHMIEHACEIIDFAALADSLEMPYRTLRHVFARETGSSLLQYQLGIRLARAKNLLRSSEMPIAEIAKSLGFNSTWYFSHFFSRQTGISPVVYRKKSASVPD